MAMSCEVCGKSPVSGNRISHAHNVTKRRFRPNLRTVRTATPGGSVRKRVCTRCLRSGAVTKVVRK